MKILSFHLFSLYSNGGGSRILRRLYQGKEDQVISFAINDGRESVKSGKNRGKNSLCNSYKPPMDAMAPSRPGILVKGARFKVT